MASEANRPTNPFQDPRGLGSNQADMLKVGRDASLTLGTESLVVSDAGLSQTSQAKCCGLVPSAKSSPMRTIPYFNILWAELNELDITIHHASPPDSTASASNASPTLAVSIVRYAIDKTDSSAAKAWIETLLARSYANAQSCKRIKVLVNPFGGSGNAVKRYHRDIEPIFVAAKCILNVERTAYNGHAREIARDLDIDAFDVVASCSGDGLPHEVFNGLGDKPNAADALKKIAVVQLPCGSGNAMSWNLNGTDSPSLAALCIVKGIRAALDLVSITQGPPGHERRTLSFLSQSVGIIAETDLGTEHLRWLGDVRFTYGFLTRLLGKTVYPCQLSVKVVEDDKPAIRARYKSYRIAQESADPGSTTAATNTQTLLIDDTVQDSQSSHNATLPAQPASPEAPGNGLPPLKHGTINTSMSSLSWPPLTAWPTLGNFYCGNMGYMARDANFFQAALPSDGCVDLVCIDGKIPRIAAAKSLTAVGEGTFFDMPYVLYRKIEAYRILPKGSARSGPWPGEEQQSLPGQEHTSNVNSKPIKPGYISIDGEHFPFEPFQVEIHPSLGTVLSRTGKMYETPTLA